MQFIRADHQSKKYITDNNEEITFHGVNIVYKLAPYYPYIRNEFNATDSLSQDDIQYMVDHGFNMVRLGVQMAGVMPAYNTTNMTYLQEMEKIVNDLGQAGIYTIIDSHQDLMSEYTCGEMLPDYSVPYERSDIPKFPLPVTDEPFERDPETHKISSEQCLSKNFATWYMADMVGFYIKCLYEGNCSAFEEGSGNEHIILQDEFKKYWSIVSSFFKDNEYVIGYDVLNEPASITKDLLDDPKLYFEPWKFEKQYLEPFYLEVIPVIYQNDQNHIIHFEPVASNWFPTGMDDIVEQLEQKGVPKDKLAWAYHVYCSTNFETADPTRRLCTVEENLQYFFKVTNGLKSLNITSFADEFGAFPDDDIGHKTLIDQIGIFEMFNQPWSYWQLKPFGDPTTCFNTQENNNEGLWYNNGSEQTEKVKILSHPYLQLCNGRIISQSYEFYGQTLTVRFITGEVGKQSIIPLSKFYTDIGKDNNVIIRKGTLDQDFSIEKSDTQIVITNLQEGVEIEVIFY